MKLLKIFLFLIITPFIQAQNQKTATYIIAQANFKVDSHYGYITVVDARKEKSNCGTVLVGGIKAYQALVKTSVNIDKQIEGVFRSINSQINKSNDTLLIKLNQFKFNEYQLPLSVVGEFNFYADVFAKKDGKYAKIRSIDTTHIVKNGNVQEKIFQESSLFIHNFIKNEITKSIQPVYELSYEDVLNIEDIEKKRIPLFNQEKLIDGFFLNYQAFSKQIPDNKNFRVNRNGKGEFKNIEYKTDRGEYLKIDTKKLYAFIENGKPYLIVNKRCVEIEKLNNDFGFKQIVSSNYNVDMGGMFGVTGALISSALSNPNEVKEQFVTINYLSGNLQVSTIK
ncbi:hypothetical protein [Flavobacterium aquicola]|uniref:Uncharacterized protein n=1 Tax=Flavobacterium aquicola TaxID=1682742 RepID=A0A3E0ETJ1_9FLAO|nr:hypothetical protein [Flavobacterium aquicola]REH01104.1 hypothetical protein C8P67_102363 [Flavobacterium aquicola]